MASVRRSKRRRTTDVSKCVLGMTAEEYNLNMHFERVRARDRSSRKRRTLPEAQHARQQQMPQQQHARRGQIQAPRELPEGRKRRSSKRGSSTRSRKKAGKKKGAARKKSKSKGASASASASATGAGEQRLPSTASALEAAPFQSWLHKGAAHELIAFLDSHHRPISSFHANPSSPPFPAPSPAKALSCSAIAPSSAHSIARDECTNDSGRHTFSLLEALAHTASEMGDSVAVTLLHPSSSRTAAYRSPIPQKVSGSN
eukprot:g801.t1